jgi:hypothetical protein
MTSPVREVAMTVRRTPCSPWPLAVVLVIGFAVPAAGGPIKVTAQADRRDAVVGQPVMVTVRVRGVTDTAKVEAPAVAGATIAPVGAPAVVPTLTADLEAQGVFHNGSGRHLVNALKGLGQMPNVGALDPEAAKLLGDPNLLKGQQQALAAAGGLNTNDHTFTYQVIPERTGLLVVPAFTVSADGQKTTTTPVSINVNEAKPQPWVRMKLSLSNPTPIIGEEVRLFVDLLIQRGQVTLVNKTYPYLPVAKMVLNLPPLDGSAQFEMVRPLEQFAAENAIEPGKRGFRLNNLPIEVKMDNEPADGQAAGLDAARYRRRLSIPLRARAGGEVTLAAAHSSGEVFVPAGGNKGQWEPFVSASEPLTFSILDLRRRADRPIDFTGAVGAVRVTSRASQTEMPAGTPFTLTVRLEGSGSVAAGAPDLSARPEFAKGFRVRTEEARTVGGNAREFTYTLRPLSEGVTQVPAVAVSYFDPKDNAFATAHSEPIPLHVTAAQNATPAAPAQPAPAAPPPAPATEDEPDEGFRVEMLLPWAEGAVAVACVGCVAAWGVRRVRRHRAARGQTAPARQVVAVARRGLSAPSPTFAGLRQTLQDFLRRYFRLPAGEVTPNEAVECLTRAGVATGLARSFAALLETCATAEFAPGVVEASPAEVAGYAQRLMDQIIAAIPEVVV